MTPWVPSENVILERMVAANATIHEMQAALSRTRGSINSKRARVQGARGPLSASLDRSRLPVYKNNGASKEDHRPLTRVERAAEPPGVLRIPLLSLRDHHCRFPLGEGVAALFCGLTVGDLPYCAFHCKIVYARPV